MAAASSIQDCINRHVNYPFDIAQQMRSDNEQLLRLQHTAACIIDGERVLDVGCNSGALVQLLPSNKVHGVDVAPAMVQKAARYMASAQVAPAEDLPFDNSSFDVVVLGELLEHVFDPVAVLAEAARVARVAIVGTTPTESSKWGKHTVRTHVHHVRCYNRKELHIDLAMYLHSINISAICNAQFYLFFGEVRA